MMKKVPGWILPPRAGQVARRAVQRLRRIHRPRVFRFAGDDPSVLQCCVAYNEHGAYCVPLDSLHRPAVQAVLAGQVWEPDTLALMAARCGAGDIVHAGTYFGDFLPALSRAVASGAAVWAFEPNPENHRCATITKLLNACGNIHLHHAGLSDVEGAAPMVVRDEGGRPLGGWSHLAAAGESGDLTDEVTLVRVDDVVPADRHVSVVQLDVEGFERQALEGALSTIRRCRPLLIVERLPDAEWVATHLTPLGYRETGRVHANVVLESSAAQSGG